MSDRYEGGLTRGGRWGCAIAGILGTPLFLFLLVDNALGDCEPDSPCHKGFWTMVLLPTLLLAVPIGLLARWVANRRNPDDG